MTPPKKGLLVLQTTGYRCEHGNLELNCDHWYDLVHLTAFEPGSKMFNNWGLPSELGTKSEASE